MSRSRKIVAKRKHKKHNNKSRKIMKGGYSPDETQHLLDNGFQQEQIDELSSLNVTIDTINQAIEYYNNNFNAHQIIFDIAKNLHANLAPLAGIVLPNNQPQSPVLNNEDLNSSFQSENAQQPENSFNSENNNGQQFLNESDLQVPEGHEIPQDAEDNHVVNMDNSLDLTGETSMPDESMNNSMDGSMDSSISNNTNNTMNSSLNGGKRGQTKKRVYRLKRKRSYRR